MMESLLSVKGNNRIALMSMEFGSVTQSTIIFINLLHGTGHYATNNVYLEKTGFYKRGCEYARTITKLCHIDDCRRSLYWAYRIVYCKTQTTIQYAEKIDIYFARITYTLFCIHTCFNNCIWK